MHVKLKKYTYLLEEIWSNFKLQKKYISKTDYPNILIKYKANKKYIENDEDYDEDDEGKVYAIVDCPK